MTPDLTARERQVARLVGRGWAYKRIGNALGMSTRTVKIHVAAIAMKIPNPDELATGTLVMLWAAHRLWEEGRNQSSAA